MANTTLADRLTDLVNAIHATGHAVLPSSNDRLLQAIVQTAAQLFGAAAGSIALVDETAGELVFRVAYGAGSETVVGMRIPLDQGIAGYVANTGQPIAISNVAADPRFARDTAEQTGYMPRSILATPLIVEERVIGVMEVLDKLDAPSFGMEDMELLGLFGQQAALAIHQSQQLSALNDVLVEGLDELVTPEAAVELKRAFAADDRTASRADLLRLADLFRSIATLGDAERRACLRVLEAFAEYAERPSVSL